MLVWILCLVVTLCCGAVQKTCVADLVVEPPVDSLGQLLQVQVITRHAQRVPTKILPSPFDNNDEWNCELQSGFSIDDTTTVKKVFFRNKEVLPGNCELGQLVNEGKLQMNTLGNSLSTAYGHLLNNFTQNNVYIRSTNVQRTLGSAVALMSSLSPKFEFNVFTADRAVDQLALSPQGCPATISLVSSIKQSDIYIDTYKRMLAPIAKTLGDISMKELGDLDSVCFTRKCAGVSPPGQLTQQMCNVINIGVAALNDLIFLNASVVRLFQSPLIAERVDVMRNSDVKFALWSGHDSGIFTWMAAMGRPVAWPAYAAHSELEVYERGVVLKFNGKVARVFNSIEEFLSLAQTFDASCTI